MMNAAQPSIPSEILRVYGFVPVLDESSKVVRVYHATPLSEGAYLVLKSYYPKHQMISVKTSEQKLLKMAPQEKNSSKAAGKAEPVGSAITQVRDLIQKALEMRASDIHCVPREQGYQIAFRIDGHLQDFCVIPFAAGSTLLNVIKVQAKLDIAENRRPQTGQFCLSNISYKKLDIRASTHPTVQGESLVMRLLNQSPLHQDFDHLGFRKDQIQILNELIFQKSGLIVVTGPTGSGKTTTLYGLLQKIAQRSDQNIMTLEQPVEYSLPGIRQTEVREKSIFSFADGVRSLLRQDPDVILIGEVRDSETASMAVRAAMTGHLVLTTLHTRRADGVQKRLQELGVDQSLVEDVLRGVLAQRLVRRLCSFCKIESPISLEHKRIFMKYGIGTEAVTYFQADLEGCDHCQGIGYHERFAVAEILQPLLGLHTHKHSSLEYHGLQAVIEGMTSFEELSRELDLLSGLNSLNQPYLLAS